jgi:hypothetical protein
MAEEEEGTSPANDENGEQPVPPSLDEWIQSFEELNQSMPDWEHLEGWIRRNPAASLLGMFGTGVVLGSWLFRRSGPPPTFSERMEATALEVGDEVRDRAEETGRNVSRKVTEETERFSKEASEAATKTAGKARKIGQNTYRAVRERAQENPELARMVADAVVTAGAAVLVKSLNSWIED